MRSAKIEILNILLEDLKERGQVVPNYGGYQYNDLLSVIKGLKDVGAVRVSSRAIKLLNRDKLDEKVELVKKYYF
jgi:hypothetical protein|tara:strand:+ start:210 stop:434 length:225 start_codon:yes stop_codon:yes gene_type:complete